MTQFSPGKLTAGNLLNDGFQNPEFPFSGSRLVYLDVPLGLLGSMFRINGLLHLLIYGIYWGELTHLLTINPNFLGHPSTGGGRSWELLLR